MADIFKATKDAKGNIIVKAIVEKDTKGNIKVKLPSFQMISKLIKEYGKRNLQQV